MNQLVHLIPKRQKRSFAAAGHGDQHVRRDRELLQGGCLQKLLYRRDNVGHIAPCLRRDLGARVGQTFNDVSTHNAFTTPLIASRSATDSPMRAAAVTGAGISSSTTSPGVLLNSTIVSSGSPFSSFVWFTEAIFAPEAVTVCPTAASGQ